MFFVRFWHTRQDYFITLSTSKKRQRNKSKPYFKTGFSQQSFFTTKFFHNFCLVLNFMISDYKFFNSFFLKSRHNPLFCRFSNCTLTLWYQISVKTFHNGSYSCFQFQYSSILQLSSQKNAPANFGNLQSALPHLKKPSHIQLKTSL